MASMTPISQAELAQIQADAYTASCDLPCVVQRGTRTPNAQGGASVTWNTVVQTFPPGFSPPLLAGLSQPSAGQLQNFGYLIGDLAAWQAKLPVWANVAEKDRLMISGETLTVQKDLTPRSYPALLTCLVTEV
jgi:hypothetical protein